jgi:predicted metalloprotease with PDZ domain
MARISAIITGLILTCVSFADRVEYRMKFDLDGGTGEVEMQLPEGKTANKFWMPAWAPGDYQIFDFGNTVTQLSFFNKGEEVKVASRDGTNGFIGESEWETVRYRVKMSRGNFSDNLLITPEVIFVSPAAVIGFADGFLAEPVELMTEGPAGWDFHGAIADENREGQRWMKAKNHETLGDSPFVFAKKLLKKEFKVADKSHFFVGFGRLANVDLTPFAAIGQKAAEQGLAEFGSFPYDRYTFFGHFGGFPAGLEHGTSTRLGLWSNDANQSAGLIFHEYVHTYNIKQIRPKSLRPINPIKHPVIDSLWWLEGTTDYFSELWMLRAGLQSKESFLGSMRGNYMGQARNPNYSKISALESSRRVFEVRGSQGFGGVSYYAKGALIGFMLDIGIRDATKGKSTLGAVIKTLYEESENDEGYAESRIGELVAKYGNLGELYKKLVETAEPTPFAAMTLKAGLIELGGKLTDLEKMNESQRLVHESFFKSPTH